MIEFLSHNIGTIVVGALVLIAILSSAAALARSGKKGKCYGCPGCK